MLRTLRRSLSLMLCVLALFLLVSIYLRVESSPRMYQEARDVPSAQAALVLGASVVRGEPSPILRNRANAAIDLYRLHKVSKILVTGDNGELTHDEVTPVRNYLLERGVEADDIFLDHAGFDTYSSVYRAKAIFGATSTIIVTQDFHLPRALFIAKHINLTSYGLIAKGEDGLTRDLGREILASVKAVFDVYTSRSPRFLGEQILLTGSGTSTWY